MGCWRRGLPISLSMSDEIPDQAVWEEPYFFYYEKDGVFSNAIVRGATPEKAWESFLTHIGGDTDMVCMDMHKI